MPIVSFFKSPDSEHYRRLQGSSIRSFGRRGHGFRPQNRALHAHQELGWLYYWGDPGESTH